MILLNKSHSSMAFIALAGLVLAGILPAAEEVSNSTDSSKRYGSMKPSRDGIGNVDRAETVRIRFEDANVIQTQEAAREQVLPVDVLTVHPPSEIHEQFLETP